MPTEPTILLTNKALPYNCIGKLTGWSGAEYAQSVYEEAFGAHVVRMPLSQWRACKDDVARGMVRRACQWEIDVDLPESPAGGEDVIARINDADLLQLDAIVSGLGPIVVAVSERRKALALRHAATEKLRRAMFSDGAPPRKAASSNDAAAAAMQPRRSDGALPGVVNYRSALKLAREVGVENPEQYNSVAEVKAAIAAQQRNLGGKI